MHINDRTFIISGGASGLGRATALDIVRHGGCVSILDINSSHGQQVVSVIDSKYPGQANFFKCDVSKTEEIQKAISATIEWISKTRKQLGGIIAAAGVISAEKIVNMSSKAPDGTLPSPMSLNKVKRVLDINVLGTIDLLRLSLPHLVTVKPTKPDSERGVVIMISSNAAFDGQPGQVAYAATKGAIRSMTLPLARDLSRYGVRVVTIAPSLFETNMTSGMSEKIRTSLEGTLEFPRRFGKPEEFAHLVRCLIENAMVNGEVVRLDGAIRMPSKL